MAYEIKSPIPGIFYRKPSPESDPFVEVGSAVETTTVICLIEVMKTFHEVRAGASGTIASIEVDDEEMVDAGQVIATLEPDDSGN
ncbi:MAG: biotin carboxyl carrier domain-containing protein [Acidimicrobiia bacterium]|nr:biotin carboxyl carrier domain-containing protein [Acidimicrobiia bacterium]MYG59069.1 biotin carboxyl carrier domain-containing protein [Acidimicrobiia bacterium]MYJ33203.1 biotin carboxyl carrier domain-containing protein [Acidimicrobiia bacterium]